MLDHSVPKAAVSSLSKPLGSHQMPLPPND